MVAYLLCCTLPLLIDSKEFTFMSFKPSKVLVNGKQWIRKYGVIVSVWQYTWKLLNGTILSLSLYKYSCLVL